jgi:hypothetical protein
MSGWIPDNEKIIPSSNIPPKFIIKDAVNIMHHLGLSANKRGCETETFKHKVLRYSIGIAQFIFFIKSILFLSLYLTMDEQEIIEYQRFFITFCDIAYFMPDIRIHWNIIHILCFSEMALRHFLLMKLEKKSQWKNLLNCITGDIKPSDIGLDHVEDIKKILKR